MQAKDMKITLCAVVGEADTLQVLEGDSSTSRWSWLFGLVVGDSVVFVRYWFSGMRVEVLLDEVKVDRLLGGRRDEDHLEPGAGPPFSLSESA